MADILSGFSSPLRNPFVEFSLDCPPAPGGPQSWDLGGFMVDFLQEYPMKIFFFFKWEKKEKRNENKSEKPPELE